MKRALLLNATYEPLNFITDMKAISLLLRGKAEVVVNMDGLKSIWVNDDVKTSSMTIQSPATIRLLNVVKRRVRMPRFRKKVLFNRDGWKCQYCGELCSTPEVEHILPSSRGGASSWMNCVTACRPCNKRKANRTPEEAGMKLLRRPGHPTTLDFWDLTRCKATHPDWELFISRL